MTTRRNFLYAGGLAGLGGFYFMESAAAAKGDDIIKMQAPEQNPDRDLWEKEGKHLRVALIGCGWYGKSDLFRMIQCGGEKIEVVALCDVNQKILHEAGALVAERQASKKTPVLYKDYRQMLSENKLDVCLVGTPDHWHALPMIAAVEAGCDVYVQKPIAVDVIECHAMFKAARKHQRVVQVGLQRRSTPILVDAKKRFIDSGEIGEVAYVNMFCDYGQRERILTPTQPPEELDFDFWTGPAPMRPYYNTYHLRSWRAFMEYGNGTIGDMGVHMFDMVRWLLNLGWPARVTSNGGIFVNRKGTPNISDTQNTLFEYENLTVSWEHRHWSEVREPRFGWGSTLFGTKGTLKANSTACDFKPLGNAPWHKVDAATEFDRYPSDETEPGLEVRVAGANRAHMWNFLARIVDRGRPVSDIEEGYISSACCILGNISQALNGATLEWDAENVCVKDNPEANALLRRTYRAPWKHPEA
ncbi:MAG: Gfo/Idh/MocA family oxidoreductase [Planctomycetia bacterium]|nr:Gfo/Idh/MocA family oxidoreductase [Planctomycetia bacterium]